MIMTVHPVIDGVRIFELCAILLSIGFMYGWLIHYYRLYGLPRCVWFLAVSYSMYASGSFMEIYSRLGEPMTWRTPLAFIGATFGLIAQIVAYHTWGKTGRMRVQNRRHGDIK
jgi:hypothetical protein